MRGGPNFLLNRDDQAGHVDIDEPELIVQIESSVRTL